MILENNEFLYRGYLQENGNFDNYIQYGMYGFSNAIFNSMTNKPNGILNVSGTLLVYHFLAASAARMQYLIFNDGNQWCRYRNAQGVWRDWVHTVKQASLSTLGASTKWLAIGDSITYGVYSYLQEGTPLKGVTEDSWVKTLAKTLNYNLTVMASRGMGYTNAVTGIDPLNPQGDRISLNTLLTRVENLTDNFNFITVMFGINDYATPSLANLSTISASVDNTIQRLSVRFPEARLVVITPLNSCREGNPSTNFCYNFSYGGRSLKDVADTIKTECVKYGVECIYATNGFLFNNLNIQTMLPDNTHPSKKAHTLISKNMIKYLIN